MGRPAEPFKSRPFEIRVYGMGNLNVSASINERGRVCWVVAQALDASLNATMKLSYKQQC